MIYGYLYRNIMKLAHKYNWHYAPPIYPEGDTQLWCKWCGLRETIRYRPRYSQRREGWESLKKRLEMKT